MMTGLLTRTIPLGLLAIAGAGCESDRAVSPAEQELAAVIVTPVAVALLPGITTQLSLVAWDHLHRVVMPKGDAINYASSNPAIATVSKAGAVTAVSPGTATIGITVTWGETRFTRIVTIHVKEARPGRYRLTAPVSESEWGMEGGSYAALLSLLPGSLSGAYVPAGAIGTFSNLIHLNPDGTIAASAAEGWVVSQVDSRGTWLIRLVSEKVGWEGRVESSGQNDLDGSFQIGDGWAAGRFTAKREGG